VKFEDAIFERGEQTDRQTTYRYTELLQTDKQADCNISHPREVKSPTRWRITSKISTAGKSAGACPNMYPKVSLPAGDPGPCLACTWFLGPHKFTSESTSRSVHSFQHSSKAFQFGQKSFDSIRFDSRYRIDFFSIRFANLITLPLVH